MDGRSLIRPQLVVIEMAMLFFVCWGCGQASRPTLDLDQDSVHISGKLAIQEQDRLG